MSKASGYAAPGSTVGRQAVPVLAGTRDICRRADRLPPAALLPANERRRAVQTVKLALAVGAEALRGGPARARRNRHCLHLVRRRWRYDPRDPERSRLAGARAYRRRGSIIRSITRRRAIGASPPGRARRRPACAAHDDSFAGGPARGGGAGVRRRPAVALIAYDLPYPAPLHDVRPIGCRLRAWRWCWRRARRRAAFASIDLALRPGSRPRATIASSERSRRLRQGTPAARSLPLLAALARGARRPVVTIDYLGDMALVDRAPDQRTRLASGMVATRRLTIIESATRSPA